MKSCTRCFLLATAALLSISWFAQAQTSATDTPLYDALAQKVQRYYNQNQIDSLYAMAADSVQQRTSLSKMKRQIAVMRSEMGRWTSMQLENIADGMAHYTASFEQSTYNFYIGHLGKDDRIGSMNFVRKE